MAIMFMPSSLPPDATDVLIMIPKDAPAVFFIYLCPTGISSYDFFPNTNPHGAVEELVQLGIPREGFVERQKVISCHVSLTEGGPKFLN